VPSGSPAVEGEWVRDWQSLGLPAPIRRFLLDQ
jgi:hypothetical protein